MLGAGERFSGPFAWPYGAMAALLDALERGPSRGVLAWHSISNFYDLVSATQGRAATLTFLDELTQCLDVAPTTRDHLRRALKFELSRSA